MCLCKILLFFSKIMLHKNRSQLINRVTSKSCYKKPCYTRPEYSVKIYAISNSNRIRSNESKSAKKFDISIKALLKTQRGDNTAFLSENLNYTAIQNERSKLVIVALSFFGHFFHSVDKERGHFLHAKSRSRGTEMAEFDWP